MLRPKSDIWKGGLEASVVLKNTTDNCDVSSILRIAIKLLIFFTKTTQATQRAKTCQCVYLCVH